MKVQVCSWDWSEPRSIRNGGAETGAKVAAETKAVSALRGSSLAAAIDSTPSSMVSSRSVLCKRLFSEKARRSGKRFRREGLKDQKKT